MLVNYVSTYDNMILDIMILKQHNILITYFTFVQQIQRIFHS